MSKDTELHVKQDEWRYSASTTSARTKVKRARSKAKRSLSKQKLKEELSEAE